MRPTRLVTVAGLAGVVTFGALGALQTQPPAPSQPTPRSPGTQPPSRNPQPSNPDTQPPRRDTLPRDQQDLDRSRLQQPGVRSERPFAFQNPAFENRFNESSQRLVRMEQRIEQSNAEQLRKLGEIRAMPAERQNAALLDLIQQMLRDQAEMHRYLVASRTAWTGDVNMSDDSQTPGQKQAERGNTPPPSDSPYRPK